MTAFLHMAVATGRPHGEAVDAVHLRTTGTGESLAIWEDLDRRRWVADGRILAIQAAGDTATVAVALTSVADQVVDIDGAWDAGFLATIRIREDTVHWVMIRDRDDSLVPGRWKVRGDASVGFGVFRVGRTIKWTDGGSEARALALVDSIRRARKLPMVR